MRVSTVLQVKNRMHQGSASCTPPAHKRLYSTCTSCAFVEVSTLFKFNKISCCCYSGTPFSSRSSAFTLLVSTAATKNSSQIFCADVVLPQLLQFRILECRLSQIRQLGVVSDPCTSFSRAAFARGLSLVHPDGLKVRRQSFRVGHHSTSAKKKQLN